MYLRQWSKCLSENILRELFLQIVKKKDRKHLVPHHCKGLAEVLGVVFNIFSFYS